MRAFPLAQRPVRHPDRVRDEVVALYRDASMLRRARLRAAWSRHVGMEIEPEVPTAGRILEIGSGDGFFSLYLACMCPGRVVTGIESAGAGLAAARGASANLSLATVYFQARIEDRIPDGPWDGIVLIDELGADYFANDRADRDPTRGERSDTDAAEADGSEIDAALGLIDGCAAALGPDGVLVVAQSSAAWATRRQPTLLGEMADYLVSEGLEARTRRLSRRGTHLRNLLVARR